MRSPHGCSDSVLTLSLAAAPPAAPSPGGAEPAARTAELLPPAPRADPTRTVCIEDATITGSELRMNGSILVAIVHSSRCEATWGWLLHLDAATTDMDLSLEVYPSADPHGGRTATEAGADGGSVRTGMLLETTATTKVCAVVVSEADGALGEPFCA